MKKIIILLNVLLFVASLILISAPWFYPSFRLLKSIGVKVYTCGSAMGPNGGVHFCGYDGEAFNNY